MHTVFSREWRAVAPVVAASMLLAASGLTQEPGEPSAAFYGADPVVAAPLPAGAWQVPPQAETDDEGRATGALWAGGETYKVRFGVPGETRFVPILGAGFERNLPLGWRTASVRLGGAELLDGSAQRDHDDWQVRWIWSGGAVVERHDLRDGGVEQSFVLHDRPDQPGDLCITLKLDTELHAAARAPAHAAIDFFAPADVAAEHALHGQPVVRYGAAVAIDAHGDRLPLETAFSDGCIRLHAPASWLATAQWPVTIDPLTSRVLMITGSSETDYPQVARDDDNNRLCLVYARAASNSDWDTYVRLRDDDFGHVGLLYTDINAGRSTRHHAVCWANHTDKWVVAAGAHTASSSYIRLLSIPTAQTGVGGETLRIVPRPANTQHQFPVLGGNGNSNRGSVLLAYEVESGSGQPNTTSTRPRYRMVDSGDLNLRNEVNPRIYGAGDHDAQAVSVSYCSDSFGWGIVWQERENTVGARWTTEMARVDKDGTRKGHSQLGNGQSGGRHELTPKIAGGMGRFLVALVSRDNVSGSTSAYGDSIEVLRVSWSSLGSSPGIIRRRVLATSNSTLLTLGLRTRPVAYDNVTDSHWAVTWRDSELDRLYVARVGHDVQAAEIRSYASDIPGRLHRSPSLCFDEDNARFPIVWSMVDANLNHPVAANHFIMPGDAAATSYGTSCAGYMTVVNRGPNLPFAGSEYFMINLYNGVPNAPVWLLASVGPGNLPLPGAPGCNLLLSTQVPLVQAAADIAGPGGYLSMPIPLPSHAAGVDVHWQVIQLTLQGLSSSRGLVTAIR